LRRYGHVLRKDDDDWVKKSVALEVQGATQRGRPRKTWKEVVDKDMNDLHLKPTDVMDRCKWSELVRQDWSDSNSASDALFVLVPAHLTSVKGR